MVGYIVVRRFLEMKDRESYLDRLYRKLEDVDREMRRKRLLQIARRAKHHDNMVADYMARAAEIRRRFKDIPDLHTHPEFPTAALQHRAMKDQEKAHSRASSKAWTILFRQAAKRAMKRHQGRNAMRYAKALRAKQSYENYLKLLRKQRSET